MTTPPDSAVEALPPRARRMIAALQQARRALRCGEHAAAARALAACQSLEGAPLAFCLSLATAWRRCGRPDRAIEVYRHITAEAPADARAWLAWAELLSRHGVSARQPIALLEQAVARGCEPDALAFARWQYRRMAADWQGLEREETALVRLLRGRQSRGEPLRVSSFYLLALCDDTALHRQAAHDWARRASRDVSPLALTAPGPGKARPLRVGYLSGDFHDHPTAHLLAGLLRAHDLDRVTPIGFRVGPPGDTVWAPRIADEMAEMHDLTPLDDREAAAHIAAQHIDVLVDLSLWTTHGRSALCAYRPAPVVVNYLGFPGSSGAAFIDAALVDDTVVPPGAEGDWQERPYRLPGCYFATDPSLAEALPATTRQAEGLPENAPVLVCFNQTYKLDPHTFMLWMRILRALPEAVLWLLAEGREIQHNLRAAATRAGIDPQRLVFAGRRPKPQHLARLALADLMLDTRHYNGHTTTADALLMGVPVVTVPGRHMASRVSASMLKAQGLEGLIQPDWQAYRRYVVQLIREPAQLQDWQRRTREAVTAGRLFDTRAHAGALETAFQALYDGRQMP